MATPSLLMTPSGYKEGKVYSILPNDGSGDFTYSGGGGGTRINKDGLIEVVPVNTPRFSYPIVNGVVGSCPYLLLEPTRTNECLYSKTLSSWTELNGGTLQTITDNDAIAPDGSLTASTITFTDTGTSLLRQFSNKAYTSNKHSSSFYAKKISGDGSVFFGITDTETEFTPTDEWVRYEVNNVTPTDFGTNLFLDLNFDCSAGDKIAVWGMQLEEGTYSTSVVETEGSAVTRTVDNVHLLNQTFITNYPFTVYANAKIDAVGNAIFSLNNTSASSYYLVFSLLSSSQVAVLRRNPSASNSDFYNFSYTVGDTIKVAVAFISATAYKLYINGTEIADRTSGTSIPFNHDDISLGQFRITGDTGTRNSVNEFMIFNEALTDSELQTLTT